MAAKIAFVFVCAFVIFQTLDASAVGHSATLKEDLEKATQPIQEAFANVKTQLYSLVEKIQTNPLYQRASETVNDGYDSAKSRITQTYDKLQACKRIIEEH